MKYIPLKVEYRKSFIREKRDLWQLDENKIKYKPLRFLLYRLRLLLSKVNLSFLYPRVGKCYEQKQIIKQLEKREEFPLSDWQIDDYCIEDVVKILCFIEEQFLWPNHNYIPQDQLCDLLLGSDANDIFWFIEDVKDSFDVSISKVLIEMLDKNKTIGDLVQYILTI